jgi:hypothetical protein
VPFLTADKDAVLDEWPEEHHGVIANMVQESFVFFLFPPPFPSLTFVLRTLDSSQTLNILVKTIHRKICELVETGIMAVDGESESQESSLESASSSQLFPDSFSPNLLSRLLHSIPQSASPPPPSNPSSQPSQPA